jgi:hypothetical protein
MSIFSSLRRCNALQDRYGGLWSFLCETMWSLTSPHEQRISGSKKIRSSVKNDFFNTIGTFRTSAITLTRSAHRGKADLAAARAQV